MTNADLLKAIKAKALVAAFIDENGVEKVVCLTDSLNQTAGLGKLIEIYVDTQIVDALRRGPTKSDPQTKTESAPQSQS